jgi:hypothetical protein
MVIQDLKMQWLQEFKRRVTRTQVTIIIIIIVNVKVEKTYNIHTLSL